MINTPMYRQIYDDLIRGIENETYPPGSRLPSEKELADLYSVSRITSKKALEMLSERGIILRKPGKGSFVLNSSARPPQYQAVFPDRSDISGNYETTAAASSSLRGRKLIGVIMDMFDPTFGCELLQGIEYECRKRNMDLLLRFTYGSREAETKAIKEMQDQGAQGILLMCSQDEVYNENILKLCVNKFPLVLIDRDLKGLPVPTVTTDNYQASCELTERLIAHGHRKICFVTHSSMQTSTVQERFYGYRDTMGKHSLKTDESLWITDIDQFLPCEEDAEDELQELIRKLKEYIVRNPDVTAYFAVTFRPGLFICQILKELGIEGKEVVCFDGSGYEDLFPSPLTHIEQDQYQMGVTAVRQLKKRLDGEEIIGKTLIPYRIVEKGTVKI